MCGIFGITNAKDASRLTYLGLFALQHRGQESAGICTLEQTDGQMLPYRGEGLVSDVFSEETLARLHGETAIGHVRYSTAGGLSQANIQPLMARVGGKPVSLVHNGNIVNADILREQLESEGAILQGTADSEIVLHLMARSSEKTLSDKLVSAFNKLTGAFSLLILTPTHLYAVVDACGYRPIVLGQLPEGENGMPAWVLSSETCALDLVGAQFVRDIIPGELLTIELSTGQHSSRYLTLRSEQSQNLTQARCSFEHIYFARPDSILWGATALEMRHELGRQLALESPVEADLVIAVPDSGVPLAMGYAEASGIPFKMGLIRNHYVGRTFIEPTQNVRNFRVRLKLNPVRELVKNKRVIVVDDSIVRGTTSRKIIELLRDAGAKEVHMRIGSPPVKHPCFYGIDTPKRRDLLATRLTDFKEMAAYLKADSLSFLNTNTMLQVFKKMVPEQTQKNATDANGGWCISCFSGKYQDALAQKMED